MIIYLNIISIIAYFQFVAIGAFNPHFSQVPFPVVVGMFLSAISA
ncbi:MAG: hypothetical protein V4683_17815 [Bacteroidota bacterium]